MTAPVSICRAFADRPLAMDSHAAFAKLNDFAGLDGQAIAELISRQTDNASLEPDYGLAAGIAVIPVQGVILRGAPEWYSWFMSIADVDVIHASLDAALDDPAVRSILLEVNSPGGTVDGVQELADAIFAARERKPVHAAIQDLGASAAYWIASQAETIAANPTASVGSIGVYLVADDWYRLYEDMGVRTHVVRSSHDKGAGAGGSYITAAQVDTFQEEIDDLTALFTAAVARGRGVSPEAAAAWAQGRVWIAGRAQDMGLIDYTENFVDTLSRIA